MGNSPCALAVLRTLQPLCGLCELRLDLDLIDERSAVGPVVHLERAGGLDLEGAGSAIIDR